MVYTHLWWFWACVMVVIGFTTFSLGKAENALGAGLLWAPLVRSTWMQGPFVKSEKRTRCFWNLIQVGRLPGFVPKCGWVASKWCWVASRPPYPPAAFAAWFASMCLVGKAKFFRSFWGSCGAVTIYGQVPMSKETTRHQTLLCNEKGSFFLSTHPKPAIIHFYCWVD